MPDLDQIKQGEQGVRDRRGRFARGRSGNPALERSEKPRSARLTGRQSRVSLRLDSEIGH
jgi:hypothetical protein